MRSIIRYLLQSILIGMAAAVVIVLLFPQILQENPLGTPLFNVERPGKLSDSGPYSYSDAVKKASPSVVNIFTTSAQKEENSALAEDPLFQHFFGKQQQEPSQEQASSLGSGVIINDQGHILTNHHVISDADSIQVLLENGDIVSAMHIGNDKETDLAVLKIDPKHIPASINVSAQPLQVGDVVLAIGNPYGVGKTVTMGIVSATGRNRLGINSIEDFIQTDAAINPGNSGGALVNARGELIGINSAIYTRDGGSQGIGFAIPTSLALGVLDHIVKYGRVLRGWLGVEGQNITPELAESFGLNIQNAVLIAGVVKQSPASRAGLQPGDIITRLDGQPIENAFAAFNHIAGLLPGERVEITGLRGGNTFSTNIEVEERPLGIN